MSWDVGPEFYSGPAGAAWGRSRTPTQHSNLFITYLLTTIPNLRTTTAASRPHDGADAPIIHVGQARLSRLARPGMRVVIAFTDATRYSPDHLLISLLLDELDSCGIDRNQVTLICATGLHRPMTLEERRAKLGPELAEQMRIVDHDALDPAILVKLEPIDGLPVITNRLCAEADLLIATGVVEPHQYAGYSGGAKTVVIGCGGEPTIEATHGAAMLDDEGTRLGAIEGNRFQAFVREAGRRIGLDYVINVLLDEDGGMIEGAAGAPAEVHDHLVERARAIYEVPVTHRAHLAIAGVSAAKGSNLYQASRAATYLALADRTPLLLGAPIIIPASIPEGAGEGTGERRFFEILSGAPSAAALVEELRRTGFPAGAQRAYILAKVLAAHPVIVAGAADPAIVRACHMHATPDLPAALELAERLARERFPGIDILDLLNVPNALVTLPKYVG